MGRKPNRYKKEAQRRRRKKKSPAVYVFIVVVILAIVCCIGYFNSNSGGTAASGGLSELAEMINEGFDSLNEGIGSSVGEESGTGENAGSGENGEFTAVKAKNSFTLDGIDIPDYAGNDWVEINDGETYFTSDEITDEYFLQLTELDSFGRAGSASMCADEEHVQNGERGDISSIEPSGWVANTSDDYVYDRSHLMMWKLSGCDDERNFVTGTVTFNQDTMLEFEEQVTSYVYDNEDNHVMYRVTPYFEDDNLVCDGVLMEAYSVEDDGGLEFCVFAYNVMDGYDIDYATGSY